MTATVKDTGPGTEGQTGTEDEGPEGGETESEGPAGTTIGERGWASKPFGTADSRAGTGDSGVAG